MVSKFLLWAEEMFSLHKRSRKVFMLAGVIVFLVVYFVYAFPRGSKSRTSFGMTNSPNTCLRLSSSSPFVSSNSTWRDLPIRHDPGPLLTFSSPASSKNSAIQHAFSETQKPTEIRIQRRDEIHRIFQKCWISYKEHAWRRDELTPITGKYTDRYGGWGATLVDNLDTLWLMGFREDFQEAVDAAIEIDFSDPSTLSQNTISVFETTIRFLGGYLSAFEVSSCNDTRLLDKAAEVGDMLYAAFDTPERMPTDTWNPHLGLNGTEQLPAPDDNIMANLGSLSLEFTRLSQLTGDMRYFTAVQRITNTMQDQQNNTRLPGMWPQRYDPKTFDFTNGNSFSLGAEADSAYEYLLKMFMLLRNSHDQADQYKIMYEYAIDVAVDNLLFRPMTMDNSNVLLSGKVIVNEHGPSLLSESEHLACFLGGMFALGSRVLSNEAHLDIGRKLSEGCPWVYRAIPAGIAPENFQTVKCESGVSCEWNETAWHNAGGFIGVRGFTAVRDPRYYLRPEALESLFYLYRITGETKYQDMAWDMFQSIVNQTETANGNAALSSVLQNPSPKLDMMESFWMAESLKYMWLLFDDEDNVSLDEWVFSTEAHPFRLEK